MYRFFLLPILTFCLLVSITHTQNYNLSNPKVQLPPDLQRSFLNNNPNKLLKPALYLPVQVLMDVNSKIIYTYDSQGNRITELHQDYANNTWGDIVRNTFTYDNNSYLITYLSENWTSGAWVNNLRNSFTHDIRGNFLSRSEERRVGKECRSRWSPYH